MYASAPKQFESILCYAINIKIIPNVMFSQNIDYLRQRIHASSWRIAIDPIFM